VKRAFGVVLLFALLAALVFIVVRLRTTRLLVPQFRLRAELYAPLVRLAERHLEQPILPIEQYATELRIGGLTRKQATMPLSSPFLVFRVVQRLSPALLKEKSGHLIIAYGTERVDREVTLVGPVRDSVPLALRVDNRDVYAKNYGAIDQVDLLTSTRVYLTLVTTKSEATSVTFNPAPIYQQDRYVEGYVRESVAIYFDRASQRQAQPRFFAGVNQIHVADSTLHLMEGALP